MDTGELGFDLRRQKALSGIMNIRFGENRKPLYFGDFVV